MVYYFTWNTVINWTDDIKPARNYYKKVVGVLITLCLHLLFVLSATTPLSFKSLSIKIYHRFVINASPFLSESKLSGSVPAFRLTIEHFHVKLNFRSVFICFASIGKIWIAVSMVSDFAVDQFLCLVMKWSCNESNNLRISVFHSFVGP